MLLDRLKKLTDSRSYHGREYLLHHIVYFTILAILCNAKTYTDVARFIKGHFTDLKAIFALKWRYAPDPSAIRKIIISLDPDEVEKMFRDDAVACSSKVQGGDSIPFQQICFDGKSLGGSFSHTKNKNAKGFFSAFAACQNIVLAHSPMQSDKGHEIKAMQDFLLSLSLKDVIVTADALHCQKKPFPAPSKLVPSF